MQLEGVRAGAPIYELRAADAGRGFHRLPPPSEGYLYFDMEGDPLHEDGLEYLLGVTWREGGELRFQAFWGHTRAEEEAAFEAFMDFVAERLARHPDLQLFHQGDRGVLPASPGRDVKNAGASIVAYEEWRQTGDAALLQAIERYNQDDCESTAQLHAWLRGIRPNDMPWRHGPEAVPIESDAADDPKATARAQWLQERQALTAALSKNTPEDRRSWSAEHHLRELTLQLLDFHRRCDKPTWWKIFSCQDMTDQELIEDIECIGKLTVTDVIAPVRKNVQRSRSG